MPILRKIFILVITIATFMAGHESLHAQSLPALEYRVKAAFLFNFTQFITCPPHSFETPDSPFIIGIFGDDPFGSFLEEMIEEETVQARPIIIQHYRKTSEITPCHILYINTNKADIINQILKVTKGKGILTVGNSNYFIQNGGMIRFNTERRKITLQINPEAAKNSEIQISSKLLSLSEIIIPQTP